jgi:hypothetical protein
MSRSPTSSVSSAPCHVAERLTPVAKWLGRQSYLDDLASLDRELYKGLISERHRVLARVHGAATDWQS